MNDKLNKQIKLTIDGQEVVVDRDTLVIEAAKNIGAEIPHFCYHRKLKPDANCRMCLVAVEKMPKLQTACSTPVAEGMVVYTNTPQVIDAHKTVLDFILANHPLDCPICDQGGRCDLQDYSHQFTAYGTFDEKKRVYEKEFFSPLIEKEMNRCVTCLRCVRYCDEVIDSKALAPFNRGSMTEIGHIGHKQLECEFCGGCVQICPVGAFTNRLSLYEFRPWMMKKTQTVCNYCGDGCSLVLETRDRSVIEVASFDAEFKEAKGRNEGDLCAKGYFGFQFVNSPNRLTQPLIRKNGQLVESSWEEALDLVATTFHRIKSNFGGKAFGGLITARCTNENLFAFQKFMRLVIGTNHIDSAVRYGHINAARAMMAVQGTNRWGCSYEDVVRADVLLLIGSHITEANPIAGLRVKAAVRKHEAKLIVASPHLHHVSTMSNIVNLASQHLCNRPGTEGGMILALIKAVIEEDLVNLETKQKVPAYVEKIRKVVGQLAIAELEAETGVPYESIKEAARTWATATRGVILFGEGVVRARGGYGHVLNLADLALLTGKLTKEGSGLAPLCEENNEQGAFEMGALPDLLPGYRNVQDPEARAELSRLWHEEIPPEKGATLMEMLELARNEQLKAIYLVGENPVGTLPAGAKVREALERAEFVVSQDLYLTETGRMSHVVLPAASFAEQNGHFTNSEGRVQPVRQAFDPIRDVRPDWEIFSQIASFMGISFDYGEEKEITDEISRLIPQWKSIPEKEEFLAALKRHLSEGTALPLDQRYSLSRVSTGRKDGSYLVIGPTLFQSGKMSLEAEGLRRLSNEGFLRMNPSDAAQLGVKDGGSVKLRSSHGEAVVKIKMDGRYSPGFVFFPDSFTEPPLKDLLTMELDPVTHVPYFKQGEVDIEKCD
jgi:NADH-quinone oxidoreductase chain G